MEPLILEVDESKGLALIAELRKRLPGYAVLKYVREVAETEHKGPLPGIKNDGQIDV